MDEPKFVAKVKLTRQGQLTLPRKAREGADIAEECELYWYRIGDYLVLTKDLQSTKELLRSIKKG